MALFEVTTENFETEVINSAEPVLLDFWAPWCGPCRMVAPTVDEIAEEGKKVGKINVDEQPDLAKKYGIMSIPTLVVIKNGEILNKAVGVRPKEAILDLFK